MTLSHEEWREVEEKILSAFQEKTGSDEEVVEAVRLLLWHIADNKRKILELREKLNALGKKQGLVDKEEDWEKLKTTSTKIW